MVDLRIPKGPDAAPIPVPEVNRGAIAELGQTADALQGSERQTAQADLQARLIERQQAEATEAATGQVTTIKAMAAARDQIEALKTDPTLTPDDVKKQAGEISTTLQSDMAAAFPSARVRERFAPEIARDGAQLDAETDAWHRAAQAKLTGQAGDAVIGASSAAIRANPTPQTFDREMGRVSTFLDSQALDKATHDKAGDAAGQQALEALALGLTDKGSYDDARTIVRSEKFGALAGGARAETLLSHIDAEEREQKAAAHAAVAAGKKAAGDNVDALAATIDEGGIIPEGQLDGAIKAAQAAGVDPEKIVRLRGRVTDMAVNKAFGPAVDPDGSKVRAELTRLNGVAADKGLSSEENMRYQRLMKIEGQRHQSDADALKPLFGKSPGGDMQVLGQIDKLNPDAQFDTANKVHAGLGYYQLLRPADRTTAIEGWHQLKADPDLIKAEGPNGTKKPFFEARFRNALGPMAQYGFLNGEGLKGYTGVAAGIYAQLLKTNGKRGLDADLFDDSVKMAMGGHKVDGQWVGGIGEVNGHKAMLPDWATAPGVERALAQEPFGDAVYSDGRAARRDDVLKNYSPVLVGGSGGQGEPANYAFVDAAGHRLKHKDGSAFIFIWRPH